jgi:four helix bundle protein
MTREFPADERFGLAAQFRRAAVSIPANIAEGFKQTGKADKLRFPIVAQGSLEECRYYLRLAEDLGYSQVPQMPQLADEVGRLLESYMASLCRNMNA